jgi:hypothetical protein
MSKPRTISLKGAAAKAFIDMARQKPAESEQETLERTATMVTMYVKSNDMAKAVGILKQFRGTK